MLVLWIVGCREHETITFKNQTCLRNLNTFRYLFTLVRSKMLACLRNRTSCSYATIQLNCDVFWNSPVCVRIFSAPWSRNESSRRAFVSRPKSQPLFHCMCFQSSCSRSSHERREKWEAMENNLIAYQSYFILRAWRANHFPWGKYVLGD